MANMKTRMARQVFHAVVLRQHVAGHVSYSLVTGDLQQRAQKLRTNSSALPGIPHDQGEFGAVRSWNRYQVPDCGDCTTVSACIEELGDQGDGLRFIVEAETS
jgi:hypothetical protein